MTDANTSAPGRSAYGSPLVTTGSERRAREQRDVAVHVTADHLPSTARPSASARRLSRRDDVRARDKQVVSPAKPARGRRRRPATTLARSRAAASRETVHSAATAGRARAGARRSPLRSCAVYRAHDIEAHLLPTNRHSAHEQLIEARHDDIAKEQSCFGRGVSFRSTRAKAATLIGTNRLHGGADPAARDVAAFEELGYDAVYRPTESWSPADDSAHRS